jgi:hypothetical protein
MLHQNNFYCHINEKNQVNRPPLFNDFYELKLNNSSLFNEFVCKLVELNTTFFCSTSPLKALNRLKSLKLA